MNDLPSDQKNPPAPVVQPSGAAKEIEPAISGAEVSRLQEVGQDVELHREVTGAGVRISPTTVTIPQPVSQMGVKAVGPAPAATPPSAVALPLSDEAIAQGLKQGVTSSWRWIAEWCVRKLKQTHLALKSMHGKVMRVGA